MKKIPNAKIFVLYHANCQDGFGAAFAAWLHFRDKLPAQAMEFIPVRYGEPPPKLPPGPKQIYILDFSYPVDVLKELGGKSNYVVVIDHHASAKQALVPRNLSDFRHATRVVSPDWTSFMLSDNVEVHFADNSSGAVMTCQYFFGALMVPVFFEYIEDRDLWQWKLPWSREFSAGLASYEQEFSVWEGLIYPHGATDPDYPAAVERLQNEGAVCLRFTRQLVQRALRNHHAAWFNLETKLVVPASVRDLELVSAADASGRHYCVPAVNSSLFQSEVCEELLKRYPNHPFVACYCLINESRTIYSLRSRPDFDCSAVAKAFGGGGHRQAAGFVSWRNHEHR